MSAELDNLTAQVEKLKDASKSIIALLNGLSALIAANKDDPAKLQALANEIKQDAQDLTDATLANTPAA